VNGPFVGGKRVVDDEVVVVSICLV
jgi:hypothetical protein